MSREPLSFRFAFGGRPRISGARVSAMNPRLQHFEQLVARQPENELFRFSLAQALLQDGQPTAAAPHFEFCVARKPDWMIPRILLGKVWLAAGRTTDAARLLEEALQLALDQHHEDPERELRALLADLGQ